MHSSRFSFLRNLTPNRTAILVFTLYLIIGLFIVKDYGISIDEPMERTTSLSTYVYVMGDHMLASDNEAVRNAAINTPAFLTWQDRFYGTALQDITVLIEHVNGFEMPMPDVILMRHIFVFLNYFAAGICFFLLLRRRFGNTWIPLLGTLFYILFPRFFGEAFFNIKDILFFSWMVIAGYFVLRWIENGKVPFLLLSAVTLAVATNTRILGLSLLLLACLFIFIIEIRKKSKLQIVLKPILLLALTYICYIVITPFLWADPLRNSLVIFRHFIHYNAPFNETQLYLGEMITREVPWHYLPVWLGVTIPLLYIVMFAVGSVTVCLKIKTRTFHWYDIFFAVFFYCTMIGYIGLQINMYDGWRHAYGMFFPLLYLSVLGLHQAAVVFRNKRAVYKRGLAAFVSVCLCCQFAWIALNHPY